MDAKNKRNAIFLVAAAVLVAAVLALCLWRRGGAGPEAPEEPAGARLQDEAYLGKLREQEQEQTGLMAEKARIDAALAKAREADPEGTGDEVKALEAAEKQVFEAFEANRRRCADIVRERILKDSENFKKKGN